MYRLIYKSRNTKKLDKESFRDLLYISAQKNGESGLTGALLATESHYLQILEGDHEALNETFSRISNDERHDELKLISFKEVDKRLFSNWGMKGFGIFQLNKDLELDLKAKYGEEEGNLRFPIEEWSSLSLLHDLQMIEEIFNN